ncbi:MAG: ABC transporter permease [Methanobrevibacter sp.]|uniref:ABC transporter permease n=1 Tax=Methanobrevibacter sp. TaxID=66852 RepID=UPI0026E0A391|nr:ABC transporter permease [Methanobrevibacter sp.]MDO5848649.1 ABC transporter permease [Methanobrevibacter sp.]
MFNDKQLFKNFSKYSFLLRELVKRDVSGKYKDSTLGFLWSFLNPLLSMIVLTIVFSFIFGKTIKNFPVYLLCGKLLFDFFAAGTNGAMNSIKGNAAIIKKIYVPKYMFSVGIICSEFVNFLISLVVLVAVMIVTKAPFYWSLIYAPIPIFFLVILIFGVGLILATATTFFTDIKYLYGVLVMLLAYMTPIFYPISIIPKQFIFFFKLNPLYAAVTSFRDIVLNGTFPGTGTLLYLIASSIVSLIIGIYVFRKYQNKFIFNL